MRDTFPMSRRAIECGKTLDETLEETLEETLADTLPSTPARLGSPYASSQPDARVSEGSAPATRPRPSYRHALHGASRPHYRPCPDPTGWRSCRQRSWPSACWQLTTRQCIGTAASASPST
jgi:hypothetical protein